MTISALLKNGYIWFIYYIVWNFTARGLNSEHIYISNAHIRAARNQNKNIILNKILYIWYNLDKLLNVK